MRRGVACERRSEDSQQQRGGAGNGSAPEALLHSEPPHTRLQEQEIPRQIKPRRSVAGVLRPTTYMRRTERFVTDQSGLDIRTSSTKPVECLWSGGDQPSPPHTHTQNRPAAPSLLLLCVWDISHIAYLSDTQVCTLSNVSSELFCLCLEAGWCVL